MDFIENSNEEFETEVKVVNRSVAILQLNELFYSWYEGAVSQALEKEHVLDQAHTFLIPPLENDNEVEDYLLDNFYVIFEALLEEFVEDEELLEQVATAENFDQWVEYNFSTFVMDTASDYELAHEDDIEEDCDSHTEVSL